MRRPNERFYIEGVVASEGAEGDVFWVGPKRSFGGSPNRYLTPMQQGLAAELRRRYDDPRKGLRVGVRLLDGSRVFVDAMKIEVVRRPE
jgi:hypothetical protein